MNAIRQFFRNVKHSSISQNAVVTKVSLLFLLLIILSSCNDIYGYNSSYTNFILAYMSLIIVFLLIIGLASVIIWIYNIVITIRIAKSKSYNSLIWGLIGFLFPILSIIAVSLLPYSDEYGNYGNDADELHDKLLEYLKREKETKETQKEN